MSIFEQVFWLVSLHFIADFNLQTQFMSENKHPNSSPFWPVVLTAHSAAHGVMVALILGPIAGVLEFVSHWLTDVAKSHKIFGADPTGFYVDQLIHLSLKGVWIALAINFGWTSPIFQ